jgi:hypothetical protein
MGAIDDLARLLADKTRPGLTPEVLEKLKILDEDVMRARLEAQAAEQGSHVTIHLLAAWVEDCRDAVGKGEVYWWTIPMLGGTDKAIRWNAMCGIPTGAGPIAVGNKEWLPGLTLKNPPLIAVIPPSDTVAACIVRVGFYEDDWAKAEVASGLRVGMEALGNATLPAGDIEAFVQIVRQPLWDLLKAKQDDYMLERDAKFLKQDGAGFGAGSITSMLTQYIRVYILARDIERTETSGPFTVTRGTQQRIVFPSSLEGGGNLAIFCRGKANAGRFGALDIDTPFLNVAIDARDEAGLASGFTITAEDDSVEMIAYYTPPKRPPASLAVSTRFSLSARVAGRSGRGGLHHARRAGRLPRRRAAAPDRWRRRTACRGAARGAPPSPVAWPRCRRRWRART